MGKQYTLGQLSLVLSVQEHNLRNLCNLGRVPHTKAGRIRLFQEKDLPAIREVCEAAGYVKRAAPELVST